MNFVRITQIYNQICDSYKIGEGLLKEEKKRLRAGMKSTLQNKFNILLVNILARNISDFKKGQGSNSPILIPERDSPVIYALLRSAVAPDPCNEEQLLSDWLTPSGIPPTDYNRIFQLHFIVNDILESLVGLYAIDEVTHKEWIRSVDISINFDKAVTILNSVKDLDMLMTYAAILDSPVDYSRIYTNEDGTKRFIREPIFDPVLLQNNIETLPVSRLADQCNSLEDFSILIQAILCCLQNKIADRSLQMLVYVSHFMNTLKSTHIEDAFQSNELIASEYYVYYRNIYSFLKNHPNICTKIEKEMGVDNLLEFFEIHHSLPDYLKKNKASSCPEKNEKEFSDAQEDKSQAPEETS